MRNSPEKLRKAPSDKYQYVFQEISFGHDFAAIVDVWGYSLNDSLNANIEYRSLRENLLDRVLKLAEENLTLKQKQVFDLFMQDLTQQEIAEKLDKTQTTVSKQLIGDVGVNGYYRSGIFDKLKMLCNEDLKIKEVLKNIQDIMD